MSSQKDSRRPYFSDVGRKFGRLTIVAYYPGAARPRVLARFGCKCECGKYLKPDCQSVRSGNSLSCGCLNRELSAERARHRATHRMSKSPEYRSWQAMRDRCYRKSHKFYYRYGGRGIRVCQQWRNSFESFLTDMGPKPSPKHSIDRHPDKNGNYEPGNCRWATTRQQLRNTIVNRLITWNGRTLCLEEWSEVTGLARHVIWGRLNKGWPVERALSEPLSLHHSHTGRRRRAPADRSTNGDTATVP
jgi:hypothetical protein